MTKGAKTIKLDEKKVKKEKSETGKRMDELRKAMQSMGVRHATVENITRFLLDAVMAIHTTKDENDPDGMGIFDSESLLNNLEVAIRGYEVKTSDKEVVIPKLDW